MAEEGDKATAAAEAGGGAAATAAAGGGGGGGGGGAEEESVKLFVGQVPKHMTEAELLAMFQEVAIVDEVTVIKDKATKASRGADPYAPDLGSRALARAPGLDLGGNACGEFELRGCLFPPFALLLPRVLLWRLFRAMSSEE
jgi:hypothetical protein